MKLWFVGWFTTLKIDQNTTNKTIRLSIKMWLLEIYIYICLVRRKKQENETKLYTPFFLIKFILDFNISIIFRSRNQGYRDVSFMDWLAVNSV